MLPFALKAVWFALCALGTIATWIVLVALAKSIGITWLPILYCVGLTVLEGIFCLGMIYRMDPFQMTSGFCLTQIFLISASALFLTGVCLTVIVAMVTSILWPSPLDSSPESTLRFRWKYLIPLGVIPIVFPVIQIVLVIKLNAHAPSDNIHCDVTGPHLWISLLGYAGIPMIESIPCLLATGLAALRVYRMHQNQVPAKTEQSWKETSVPGPTTTVMSQASRRTSLKGSISAPLETMPSFTHSNTQTPTTPTTPSSPWASPHPPSIAFAQPGRVPPSPVLRTRPEQSPLRMPSESNDSFSTPITPRRHYAPSIASSSAPSVRSPMVFNQGVSQYSGYPGFEKYDIADGSQSEEDDANTIASHRPRDPFRIRTFDLTPAKEEDDLDLEDLDDLPQQSARWDRIARPTEPLPAPSFVALIWRLILFFFLFFLIQILVTLSTLIDVGRGRHQPTPFGTQHVALLMAAWGPSVIFAHSPGIRKHLMFWRN